MEKTGEDISAKSRRREETETRLRAALEEAIETEQKISISGIARAAGVSASLIHTKYPTIASEIRARLGISKRSDVELLRIKLVKQEELNRELRAENQNLQNHLASVVSVNATLMHEVSILRATQNGKVATFPTK